MRGIYAASLLAQVESRVTGLARIADHVDMIAGTSTGGIIALGLGLRLEARQIETLYVRDGRQVFPPWRRTLGLLTEFWQTLRPLHDHAALERLLYGVFGDAVLGQSATRLVIPAFLVPRAEIAVFKTDHHPDFENDHRTTMWEVARATSAAPTYLSGHDGEGYMFLDGGVWANNPVMVAIVDALTAYDITREQIKILSIGTGNPVFEIGRSAAKGGRWSWRHVINAAIYLTTDNALAQANLILGPERVLRLQPDEDGARIALDDWQGAARKLPVQAERDFNSFEEELRAFFADAVEPRHRFFAGGA